ncbi:peptidylprolyl isomerase SurA [Vibrio nitrifigilis]|uniref:Chaperone SurA n=1 Tax=Vibrio nitrifigilis TaxID=2789781 RepID=A0ABS0GG48_9VIBR|nr:peptidylprolyl isomerase SurA [Vibrio nitrifigilis]MBF9001387.1 peptidylprolyl isomerase SurA [Vibrio nitrifigilis]
MKLWKHALICLVTLLTCTNVLARPVELDKVAVIVNDGVILQSDVDNAIKTVKANVKQSGKSLPSAAVLHDQVIDKLILDKLQEQEAKRIGVKIDDARLTAAIKDIAQRNKQSIEQLKQSVKNEGLTYEEFRNQIRKEMEISEARNALVRRRINIIPAEVDNMAKLLAQQTNATVQYKISHIQLRYNDDNKDEMEKKAQDLVKRLKSGADFSQLAMSYSKGPKALNGGDWGWMRKEEMPTIFADHISDQHQGDIIGPFTSGAGVHILKITAVKGLKSVAVTEVNARHILIKPSVILSDEGAKKELNSFIRRIKNGEATFGELAQQYSQDPGSASQKGELGYQTPDMYVPEFKHQVETLPVGQISQPFKTVHGWHIVQVLDRRKVDKTDAAMKNKAYRILFNRKFNEEATAWLQELRASAYIEIQKGDDSDS